MKTSLLCFCVFILLATIPSVAQNTTGPVAIQVDLATEKGPLKPIWAWFGYDEPNYTYMKGDKNS